MEAALEKALANPGLGVLLLDERNRGLAEDVEKLRQEVSHSEDTWKLENDTKRRNAEYLSDMTQMLDNIQKLVSAHQKDVESESKQEKAASSEADGILRQCRKKHGEISHVQEASEYLESLINQHQREHEDLQKNLTGDSSLLKELLDHLAEADNDNLLLLQYSAEDASKIKELSVALERASAQVAVTESELSSAQAEAAASQTTLDQLSTAFLQAAAHRDHLLAQWEITLNHIYQKANEQTLCIEDSLAAQQKIGILQREVEQENQILRQVQSSCQQVLTNIQVVDDESVLVNTHLQAVTTTKEQIQSQIWALQNALIKVNKEIESLNIQLSEQRSFREEKEAFYESMEQKCKKSEEKLTVNTELVISVEESLQSLEAMLKDAEALARGLNKQKERIVEAEQHHEEAVAEWHRQELLLKGEITALSATKARNLVYIKELDTKAVKQKEVLHDQELNIQQLRRRIHDLTHDRNNNAVDSEEQKQLELLQLRLKEISVTIKMLTKQLTLLKNSRSQEQTNVIQLQKQSAKMEAELTTVKMTSESAERECARLSSKTEELMVDVSLSQLHLQRRMAQLQAVMAKVSQLAEDKSDMEKLITEQIRVVKERVDKADVTLRALNSEMHRLFLQLHEVTSRIDQLKDKHSKIKMSLDTPEGEEGVSTTQVFLKVANERAGLQETGDLLDLEVRRAEEEVEALQQMLTLISIEGQQYRSQLHDILHHSEEQKERIILEENLASLEEEIQVWETMLDQAQVGLQNTQSKLHEVELQVHAVEELLKEKNIHMTAVQRETESHCNKARHAAQATATMQWRTRGKSLQQYDIELRLAQERLRAINSLLGDAVSHHPEARESVVIYCQQVNIPPPDVTKLTKKESFGSRSSIGTLHSSRSSSASRPRSGSPGNESWKSRSHHSSMSSLHSQDSGRSGSPYQGPPAPRSRRASSTTRLGIKPVTHPGITVLSPVFPTKDVKRHHYQGKKLSKRPTMHL
ncbi:coiled-coil domain-containing protein 39-like [Penaeus monodon]|uniref:coiled-coil domain-containing protein 39-like n=1 Tax=Penaeus monodon TaxID=6687 RepID=UPI0018A7DE6D|nr:coiled-coil domain-containing protein 39-like [Penaeus monodon]